MTDEAAARWATAQAIVTKIVALRLSLEQGEGTRAALQGMIRRRESDLAATGLTEAEVLAASGRDSTEDACPPASRL